MFRYDKETNVALAGMVFPFPGCTVSGVYEVVEVLGEITLRYVGESHVDPALLGGLKLEELRHHAPAMTEKEHKEAHENKT